MLQKFAMLLFTGILFLSGVGCSKASTEELNEMVAPDGMPKQSGVFMGRQNQSVSGRAQIFLQDGRYVLKLSDFKSDNGPDLKVYLSIADAPAAHISLGDLKSVNGNQVYDIKGTPDFSQYRYALIHCERYNHLFGSAELK
jgi:hypothetical protein